jgi:hypothetical protein
MKQLFQSNEANVVNALNYNEITKEELRAYKRWVKHFRNFWKTTKPTAACFKGIPVIKTETDEQKFFDVFRRQFFQAL